MTVDGKKQTSEDKNYEALPRKKDFWDKADVIFKFLAAALIALFGFWGNQLLQEKQKLDSNIKLYTQLLSNKETSENTLRKDMFNEILQSFLQTKKTGDKEPLQRIQEMLLSLELLARNFHESLDMKPLFKYLLMEIIDIRRNINRFSRKLEKCSEMLREQGGDLTELNYAYNQAKIMSEEVMKITEDKKMLITKKNIDESEIKQKKELAAKMLKNYNRELDSLVAIAKRVTRKQREVLEDVSGKLSLTIQLEGEEKHNICTAYRPIDWLPTKSGICTNRNKKSVVTQEEHIKGISTPDTILTFKNAEGIIDDTSSRYFLMRVRYIYPKWKQIYVEVLTCPIKKGETMTENDCSDLADKEKYDNPLGEKAGFWLEYFDFPLIDNTYLNSTQRYSVILDGFETDEEGDDIKAKITLLYYPSSYAGLKEKSFYNNQLMQGLLKSKLFSGKKTVNM